MPLTNFIEVAVPPGTTTTERGQILENFARRFLDAENFGVVQNVRLTGAEVDLLATDKTTGKKFLVECKAQRQTISSSVISKLLGNVEISGHAGGWLISTYALGKDAKGIRENWEQRPPHERQRLRIFDPTSLIARLIELEIVFPPESLVLPVGYRSPEEVYLLLTQRGEFWGVPLLDEETGVRSAAALYHAKNGQVIRSAEAHQFIKTTDSNLAELDWVSDLQGRAAPSREPLAEELQNIVRVPVADRWADYRPARPSDFVGRDALQREVFSFFDRVRRRETTTRLMAVKAPSGLGKSSLVLKIADRAHTGRNARRYFVFPVDSRAAASRRFGEFAFVTMVREAIKQQFVASQTRVAFGGSNNPFSTLSMQQMVHGLQINNRVLCLFFDQFEELLYREDLENCFNEIRNLCHAIDAAQENIIIAFSWKTGGSLPEGHEAYHLWHSLANRRLDFDIPLFTGQEVTSALRKFEKELKEPLVPQLRRMLYDNCQGLPWLLKKLSIHVLELLQTGVDQIDATLQSLHIHTVFERDINQLSHGDYACLKEIAEKSSAEFFETRNIYGDEVLNRLLDKRLIILSGQKLSIYWDIFREFLITDRVPEIPVSYIPKSGIGRYVTAIICLVERREIDTDDFRELMEITERSAYFLLSDLVTIGHAEVDKQAGVIKSLTTNVNTAEKKLIEFVNSHTVFKQILDENGYDTVFDFKYFYDVVVDRCRLRGLRKITIQGYAQSLRRYFELRSYMPRQRWISNELLPKVGDGVLRRRLEFA